ncbi:MAG: hypothetical protein JW741_09080 [Sedimentisphaerales bacterium]|nr:hypothetical protein [Sedimentisphaerales bacterium]
MRGHRCLFGQVSGDAMQLNAAGRVVAECWRQIPAHFPQVEIDEFIVMPNHVHGILMIVGSPVGANNHSPIPSVNDGPLDDVDNPCPPANQGPPASDPHYHPNVRANDYSPLRVRGTSKTIGSIIRGFKVGVTRWMRTNVGVHTVWQRNYFEHVIRNEQSLHHIRRYIVDNPASWPQDPAYPQAVPQRHAPS